VNNLYLLTQEWSTGYDTYDSCVVCAPSVEEAKNWHPSGQMMYEHCESWEYVWDKPTWRDGSLTEWACKPEQVECKLIGVADDSVAVGVVCASFNAG
jgi:hypothetical protein